MFSQDKADAICQKLSEGMSLRRAAESEGITASNVLYWTRNNKAFLEQYARAREIGYQLLADDIIDISDDSKGDVWTDDDGNDRTDAERVARSKLRVDSRKWMLSKMLPKVYGDKLDLTHAGDAENPVRLEFGWAAAK